MRESPRELRATVRLQLRQAFTFTEAAACVPYYHALGISHFYLSPIARARPSSTHGYDVLDPTVINPELGGEKAFRELIDTLHAHGMGAIADIVPNHMAADVDNPWWRDVLVHGPHSRYAHFFDIEWDAPGLDGRLGLPVLSGSLEEALGDSSLRVQATPDALLVDCHGQRLPVSSASLLVFLDEVLAKRDAENATASAGDLWREATAKPDQLTRIQAHAARISQDQERMTQFLDQQTYRLLAWTGVGTPLNYRRFFDINGLAAIAIEKLDVFDAVHALPLRLVAEGLLDGLRVDHVDGLREPYAYLKRLRNALDVARSQSNAGRASLHVEKILARDESLRHDWPVDGTTGYEFMDQVGALAHDPAGEPVLRQAWSRLAPDFDNFDRVEWEARRLILATSLRPERSRLTRWWMRDATWQNAANTDVGEALEALLEHMPVYRTYLAGHRADDEDRRILQKAIDAVPAHDIALRLALAELQRRLLTATSPDEIEAVCRFEQTSSALNAKAVEDTAFYRYGVLLSRNEVGSDPRQFSLSIDAFHHAMRERAEQWPHALSATATHDHKRGEDARARLAVISERATWFTANVQAWWKCIGESSPSPSAADLWMLWQTALASYPLCLQRNDAATRDAFGERLKAWQTKSLREAKLHGGWQQPDLAYEAACGRIIDMLCAPKGHALADDIEQAARSLDTAGALYSLAAVTLRCMAPGVPDLYQGCDRWDLSMVDPDNRQPVDYASRVAFIHQQPTHQRDHLLDTYRSGEVKQWLIARLLACRNQAPESFAMGSYRAMPVQGRHASSVVAFSREEGGQRWLIAVPRACADLLADSVHPHVPPARWHDTHVRLPDDMACTYDDAITGVPLTVDDGRLELARLWAHFPVAVLKQRVGL